MASSTSIPSPKLTKLRYMGVIIHIHLGMINRIELWPPSYPAQVCRPQFSYHLPQPLLIMLKLIILSLRCADLNSPINSSHLLQLLLTMLRCSGTWPSILLSTHVPSLD